MKKYDFIFCDLDGILIETISGEATPKGVWDMRIKFDVLDAIKKLNPHYIFIVTNQDGIEGGFVNDDNFCAKVEYVAAAVREYCGCKCYFMYCLTDDRKNSFRKPNPGMLEELLFRYVEDYPDLDRFDSNKKKSLMIGGQSSDIDKKAAKNFGIAYMDVNDFVSKI